MNDDRIRVTFSVDPAGGRILRDGSPVELSPDLMVHDDEGRSITLAGVLEGYSGVQSFNSVADYMTTDMQEAVGLVLYNCLGIDALKADERRWLEISVEGPPVAHGRDLYRAAMQTASFIKRLPWPLAYDPVIGFLAQREWVFTLVGNSLGSPSDQIFPPEPRVLLMLPLSTVDGDVAKHGAEVRSLLKPCYSAAAFANNVCEVNTWPEAYALLRPESAFDPDVIYFYGHGFVDGEISQFQFDPGPDNFTQVSANQIEAVLKNLPQTRRPSLFFANCCKGAIAGKASVGDRLGGLVGCVIANRTVIDVPAAQRFGTAVLSRLIAEVQAPHEFMADVTNTVFMEVTSSELGGRWASPVVHTNYDRWIPLRPRRYDSRRSAAAGRVFERLDRDEPVGTAVKALGAFLTEHARRVRALAWQSESVQGCAELGTRLRDELLTQFTTVTLRDMVVYLQPDAIAKGAQNYRSQIFASMHRALGRPGDTAGVTRPARLADVLDRLDRHLADKGVVLLFRTIPVTLEGELGQQYIREYWETWIQISERLEAERPKDAALRILLAIGLETPAGVVVQVDQLLETTATDPAALIDLGVLRSVSAADIAAHLADFDLIYDEVLPGKRPAKAAEIHADTQGVFLPTVLALKALAKQS